MRLDADHRVVVEVEDGDLLDLLRPHGARRDAAGEAQDGDALERRLLDLPLEQFRLSVAGHLQRNAQTAKLVADGVVARALLHDAPVVDAGAGDLAILGVGGIGGEALQAIGGELQRGCSATAFL